LEKNLLRRIFALQKAEDRTPTAECNQTSLIRLPPGSLTSPAEWHGPDSLRRKLNDRLKKGEFMKSIVMPKTVQLTEKTEQLGHEVKEVSATEANTNKKTKFTAVDMWNRQRKSRSASTMLRKWNFN